MSAAPAVRAAESHRGGGEAEAPELSVSSSEPVSAKQAEKAITAFLAATPGLGADAARARSRVVELGLRGADRLAPSALDPGRPLGLHQRH